MSGAAPFPTPLDVAAQVDPVLRREISWAAAAPALADVGLFRPGAGALRVSDGAGGIGQVEAGYGIISDTGDFVVPLAGVQFAVTSAGTAGILPAPLAAFPLWLANDGPGLSAFAGVRSRGTPTVPTGVMSGDVIVDFAGAAFDSTGAFVLNGAALMRITVDSAPAVGIIPGRIDFRTQDAAGSQLTRLTIRDNGFVGVAEETAQASEIFGVTGQAFFNIEGAVADRWIRLGSTDAFARVQLWHTGTDAVLRLGADTADGDAFDSDSQGIVIYRPSADQLGRMKADRFALTRSSDSSLNYFFANETRFFYSSDPTVGPVYPIGSVHFYVDRATGFVGINNAAAGFPTPFGAEIFRVQGDARVDGKLTVTGVVDPTAVLLSDPAAGNDLYFESADGQGAAVSPANRGRLRYNNLTGEWEASQNGGAYSSVIEGLDDAAIIDPILRREISWAAAFPAAADVGLARGLAGLLFVTNGSGAAGGNFSATLYFATVAGTSALVPAYTFTGDPDTGVYSPGADSVGITTGGALRLTVATAFITFTLPFRGPAGSSITPTYSFSGDTNTGIFNSPPDVLEFSTGGVSRLAISTASVASTLIFLGPNGSAAAPTFSFSSDTNTGIYRVASDDIGFSAGGTLRVEIHSVAMDSSVSIRGYDGGGGPTFSATLDQDTGMTLPGGDIIRFLVGGSLKLTLAAASATLEAPLLFTDNTLDIGATGATRPRSIYVGTSVNIQADRGGVYTNQTSSAGASIGTLTNAPAAGNPAFWLKVSINAANYAIPCWNG